MGGQVFNFVRFNVDTSSANPVITREFRQYTKQMLCLSLKLRSTDLQLLSLEATTISTKRNCIIFSYGGIKGLIIAGALFVLYHGSAVENFVTLFPQRFMTVLDLEEKSRVKSHTELIILETILFDATQRLTDLFSSSAIVVKRYLPNASDPFAERKLAQCQQQLVKVRCDCTSLHACLDSMLDSDEELAMLSFVNQRNILERRTTDLAIKAHLQHLHTERCFRISCLHSPEKCDCYSTTNSSESTSNTEQKSHSHRECSSSHRSDSHASTRSCIIAPDHIADCVEAYDYQIKSLVRASTELLSTIKNGTELTEFSMDTVRNKLLYLELKLMFIELSFDATAVVVGILGMNFYIPYGNIVWVWFAVFIGCCIMAVGLYFVNSIIQTAVERKNRIRV